ncbi:hypothetical protein UFOVP136_55 [uncultured Caudovirales phage]|uniref:Uncharacterized protein n=1 Tax=uncultured Caudovirales phage TaxID=2100421 RepID=A0A6J5LC24_9CAUD|nr:hypothetical protein UFOVP136_55 [uncultured Caudovirales phage]
MTEKRKRGRPATGKKHTYTINVGVDQDVHDFVSIMAIQCDCAKNKWLLNLVKKEMERVHRAG